MSEPVAEPLGTIETALDHTRRLLTRDPRLAAMQAREILGVLPQEPRALVLLGLALAELGEIPGAIAALKRAVARDPDHSQAWRALGDLLALAGEAEASHDAYARHIRASVHEPVLIGAADALCAGRLDVAERLLRPFLDVHPTDVAAIRLLAEIAARLARYEDAENLLARCLELAPAFDAARHNYATVLHRQNKAVQAIAETDRLLAADPRNAGYRSLKAAALSKIGEQAQAAELYGEVLASHPDQPKAWMSYGHALKAIGRADEAVAAYRRCLALAPTFGEAWWSLANLKTFRFSDQDIADMRVATAHPGLDEEDAFHLGFALGKALEDREAWAASFEAYAGANALRRRGLDYDADETTANLDRARAFFTPELFAARAGQGWPAPDPIFVVGLPRSGSTLVEQILSSHSQVEGTTELPDIALLARRVGGRRRPDEPGAYPEALADIPAAELDELGRAYLEATRVHRKLDRPLFIDKMPNNFAHIGLIQLILPNARIIDVRRHPMACGFSGFKQHFARGQAFTYDLSDIGRWYADYAAMMQHMDIVLPDRIHRVIYERLIADPEAEVRALLDYCGLPFELACLRFWETDRTVRTASSEQVRRPLYTEALDHWRHYEPWLEPLRTALGTTLETWSGPVT